MENASKNYQNLRLQIRWFMNQTETNLAIAALIMVSVGLLFVEGLHPESTMTGVTGDIITWLFVVELTLRGFAAPSHKRFFFQYSIDILSLLPLIFPSYSILRALRLLRLFRLGPLMVQSNKRVASIIRQTMGEQLTILTLILVTVLGATLALFALGRHQDLDDAFWWSLMSMVAGEPLDSLPESIGVRVFTLVLMVGGLTVFALFTGTVSAVMAERLIHGWSSNKMNLADLSDHIIICGWNRSGRILLEEFQATDDKQERPVVIIAEDRPEFPEEIEADPNIHFLEGDYTTVDVLEMAGVKRAATAILLADKTNRTRSDQDRDARTILAGLMIEKLHPGIFTCAELLSRDNEVHLRLAGIEEVVIGDDYSATILATSSRVRGVVEIADEIFSNKYGNKIYKKQIRQEWAGQSFLALQQRMKMTYDALLIAIEKAGGPGDDANQPGETSSYQRTITNPPAGYVFKPGDRVILLSSKEPRW